MGFVVVFGRVQAHMQPADRDVSDTPVTRRIQEYLQKNYCCQTRAITAMTERA
jgi:hypothetical protein